jgi:hypothetical protein
MLVETVDRLLDSLGLDGIEKEYERNASDQSILRNERRSRTLASFNRVTSMVPYLCPSTWSTAVVDVSHSPWPAVARLLKDCILNASRATITIIEAILTTARTSTQRLREHASSMLRSSVVGVQAKT